MADKIYDTSIRTGLGRITFQIFDNNVDSDTPNLYNGDIVGGLSLKQDDTGKSGKGLPLSRGSYFEVTLEDNGKSKFQNIFRTSFDKFRYSVRLVIEGIGTWIGYVKSELQTRPIARNTSKNLVTISCYDGLGDLESEDSIANTESKTITLILQQILQLANPELDIAVYIDFEAKNINDNFVGIQNLVPTSKTENRYAPGSGDLEGLGSGDPRSQLDELCATFNATLFQDIKNNHWSFIDIQSIGESVDGMIYKGGTWGSYTFPKQVVENEQREIIRASNEELESLSSASGILVEAEEWSKDPRMEQYPNTNAGSLYFWEHSDPIQINSNNDPKSTTILELGSSSDYVRQTVDVNVQIQNIDQVWFSVVEENNNSDIIGTVTYGDGTSSQSTGSNDYEVFVDVDQSKNTIQSVKLEVTNQSATHLVLTASIKFVSINTVPDLQGNTKTRKKVVNNFLFKTDDKGRKTFKDEAGYALVLSSSDAASTPKEWRIKSSGQVYDKLMRARAVKLLSIKAPGLENLRTEINQKFIPLGTKIRAKKRDNPSMSEFVGLKGRDLIMGGNLNAGTKVNDIELPRT